MPVQLSHVVSTTPKAMPGFAVRSLEITGERSSPVMVVDDFQVSGRPFGPHPHAGFSAMSYVFPDSPGSLRNRDSLGGHLVVEPGGLCWLQAGSGAQHEEIPADPEKPLMGLQVFVNLSAKNKHSSPHTLSLASSQVPVWKNSVGPDEVRVLVGSYEGIVSPLVPLEAFTLLDVDLRREVRLPVAPRQNVVLYVRRGAAALDVGSGPQRLTAGQAVIASGGSGTIVANTTSGAQVLILAGTEIDEPLVMHGPFVMNDQAEIIAAVERYQSGRMGHLDPFAG